MRLTHERLIEIAAYDPYTGEFTRCGKTGKKGRIGARMGTRKHDGYRELSIDGESFYEHRLAWFYITGDWPADEIDHADGDPSNNKWGNLREADRAQNVVNSRSKKGDGRPKGVHYYARYGKYQSQITARGLRKHLGYFDTAQEAANAYASASRELHGAFSRTS